MKVRNLSIFIVFSLLLVAGSTPIGATSLDQVTKSKLVLVLTVDAFRHDFLDLSSTPDIPTFDWVVSKGLRAKMLVPNPTLTATGHVSISAGANASVHGIMGNTFYHWTDNFTYSLFDDANDPYRNTSTSAGILQAPMGYHWAVYEGRKSGIVSWPYAEGNFRGIVEGSEVTLAPTTIKPYSEVSSAPDKGIASAILSMIDSTPDMDLIYARFRGVDNSLHHYGIGSPQYIDSWKGTDEGLNVLLHGLKDRGILETTTIMIMGDHGIAPTTDSKFFLEETSEYKSAVATIGETPIKADDSGFSYLYFKHSTVQEIQDFASTLRTNSKIDKVLVNEEHMKYGLYNPSVGMNISVWFHPDVSRNFGSEFANMHGYLNTNEDMKSTFLIFGAGVNTSAELTDLNAIDVTPTALDILNINPLPTAQGISRTDLLADVTGPDGSDLPVYETEEPTSSTTTEESPAVIFPSILLLSALTILRKRRRY